MAFFGILRGESFAQVKDAFRRLQTGLYDLSGENFRTVKSGWSTPDNYTETRTFDADSTSLNEIADVLATLIEDLKETGVTKE